MHSINIKLTMGIAEFVDWYQVIFFLFFFSLGKEKSWRVSKKMFLILLGCQKDWFNQCKSNRECCSNYCNNRNGTWLFGVCQPLVN